MVIQSDVILTTVLSLNDWVMKISVCLCQKSFEMGKHNHITRVLWILVCPLILIFTTENLSLAQSSVNYQLINSVADQGGVPSQSSNHEVIDAVGQPSPLGVSSSTNYNISSGFFSGRVANQSTSSESDIPGLYKEFQLYQNYPNPFNTETTIRFALPEAGQVKLEIYNILGKQIATLFDEYRSPGFYHESYNGSSLSPGVYLYKIQTQQFQDVKLMNRIE